MDEYNPSINGTTEVQPQGYQDQTLPELPTDEIVQESEDFEIETSNDRTREQFNKLKTKNKEMYEELQQLRKTRNADSVAYGSSHQSHAALPGRLRRFY
jgi:hypothetical protein